MTGVVSFGDCDLGVDMPVPSWNTGIRNVAWIPGNQEADSRKLMSQVRYTSSKNPASAMTHLVSHETHLHRFVHLVQHLGF